MTTLEVLVDGVPMAEADARAFWKRFSDHMEAHRGDLAGFAKAEGFASVHPGVGPSGARLLASRSAPQGPYRNVSKGSGGSGGSSGHQAKGAGATNKPKKRKK